MWRVSIIIVQARGTLPQLNYSMLALTMPPRYHRGQYGTQPGFIRESLLLFYNTYCAVTNTRRLLCMSKEKGKGEEAYQGADGWSRASGTDRQGPGSCSEP